MSGESGLSGRNPGLDEKAKKQEIMGDSQTNDERELSHELELRSGPEMGEFFSRRLRLSSQKNQIITLKLRNEPSPHKETKERRTTIELQQQRDNRRIAVLPLANMSQDAR